jgi:hypothetical protein
LVLPRTQRIITTPELPIDGFQRQSSQFHLITTSYGIMPLYLASAVNALFIFGVIVMHAQYGLTTRDYDEVLKSLSFDQATHAPT